MSGRGRFYWRAEANRVAATRAPAPVTEQCSRGLLVLGGVGLVVRLKRAERVVG
jgi:hypothetical protein